MSFPYIASTYSLLLYRYFYHPHQFQFTFRLTVQSSHTVSQLHIVGLISKEVSYHISMVLESKGSVKTPHKHWESIQGPYRCCTLSDCNLGHPNCKTIVSTTDPLYNIVDPKSKYRVVMIESFMTLRSPRMSLFHSALSKVRL